MMWHGPTRCRQDGREKARIELSKEAVWLANVDGAATLQVGGDAGGPERIAANLFGQADRLCPLFDHPLGVDAVHRAAGQRRVAVDGAEERAPPISAEWSGGTAIALEPSPCACPSGGSFRG